MSKTNLVTKEAASYIGMSEDFMKRARITGKGPMFVKIGRKVLYRIVDLDNFVAQNLHMNLSTINFKRVTQD